MKINQYTLLSGAKKATGCTVIIDVFRAFTVEAYLIHNGAEKVIPVGDKELAYKLKEKDSNIIMIGERHGMKLIGFDYGNSPDDIHNVDFTGKTVVHTTSAGTQGLVNATGASVILTASLVNARAVAEYIKKNNYPVVSIVAMGLAGEKETDEDNLCSRYIKDILLGNDTSYLKDEIEKIKYTDGAKFFDPAKPWFAENDFYLSTEYDKFDFVLEYIKNGDYGYIKKI